MRSHINNNTTKIYVPKPRRVQSIITILNANVPNEILGENWWMSEEQKEENLNKTKKNKSNPTVKDYYVNNITEILSTENMLTLASSM